MANEDSIGPGSPDIEEEDRDDDLDQEHISPLLGIPRCMSRVYYLLDAPEDVLDCRAHRPVIPFDKRCEFALKNLGLHQVALIQHVNTDHRLITALVERWRPETHTFHLPVGEVTVTLQDVSCLWGLPITGDHIVGYSDRDSQQLIEANLGVDMSRSLFKSRKKKTKENQEKLVQSGYRISLNLLRAKFKRLDDDATPEDVARYTRAFILDLLGSILFPDVSGDSVPVMYLRFLQDLDTPRNLNWGVAVLACLYRNLSNASLSRKKTISGALLLLQHWSWTRFPIARPSLTDHAVQFGVGDEDSRPPFALKWKYYKTYEFSPAHSSLTYYRNEFENMLSEHVNWQPYDAVLNLLPGRVLREREYWLARVPLICFWIVSWHYPERVMRQFGLFQPIPPLAPHIWTELRRLDKIVHTNRTSTNWAVKHMVYVEMWKRPDLIHETRQYDHSQYLEYRRWFQTFGMYSVYIRGQIEAGLERPLPPPRDSIEELGYIPGGNRLRRMGLRSLNMTKHVIKELYKRGTKRLCKVLLRSLRLDAVDADRLHEFERVLIDAGLPNNVEMIDDNDDDDASDVLATSSIQMQVPDLVFSTGMSREFIATCTSTSLGPLLEDPPLVFGVSTVADRAAPIQMTPQLVPYGSSDSEMNSDEERQLSFDARHSSPEGKGCRKKKKLDFTPNTYY